MSARISERRSSLSSRESMEDTIVQQYKDTIGKTHKKSKRSTSTSQSPYLQTVAPENSSIFSKPLRKRPMSAKPASRRRYNSIDVSVPLEGDVIEESTEKEAKDDDEYSLTFTDSSSNSEKDEKIFENTENTKKTRPASAQLKTINLDTSNDITKPIFKRQSYTITCNAYKNGALEGSVRIATPSIKQLLEDATLKLGLNTAARRVFLFDGSEVFRPQDVSKDTDVFISRGEPFRDPYRALKNSRGLNSSSAWSMKGISLPPRRRVKPPGSKRLNELVGKHTMRVVVYKNGDGSASHEVVFNQQNQPARFLDDCTQRLGLNASARILYNWRGNEVEHIKQVDKIDMKITSLPMYGPLWVSKCEGFSPIGSQQYIEGVITGLRAKLQGAKQCKHELDLVEKNLTNQVSNTDVLNLDEKDVPATKDKVTEDIKHFKSLIKKYKSRWRIVNQMATEQNYEGATYTMKNIKEIDGGDRLVGEHGLRLRIYDNGSDVSHQDAYLNMRDIQRGAKDPELIRARFLEALTSWHKPTDPTGPARSVVVRRIFDENGDEIKDVMSIKNEDNIWLSYGEDFKPSQTPVLTLKVEKASAVTLQDGDKEILKVYGETLNDKEDLPKGAERFTKWDTTQGFPLLYNAVMFDGLAGIRKHEIQEALKHREFSSSDPYIQYKQDSTFVLHPSISTDKKMSNDEKMNSWLKEAQTWVIKQNGKIYSRAFPSLALSLDNDRPITVCYKDGTIVEGFAVTLKKKNSSGEEWGFSSDGNIYTLHGMTQQVLTYLDSNIIKDIKESSRFEDENEELSVTNLTAASQQNHSQQFTIAVLDKFKGHSSRSWTQRWAIKQESLSNPCQWKHTKVSNQEWRKQAYSWPVLPDGNWNNEYKWPLEGVLMPNAPPLTNRRKTSEDGSLRLKVYKNGEKDFNRFVYIVAPDLSNMEKDTSKKTKQVQDTKQIEDLELTLFLERATTLLALSFAARRLFDENGKEIISMRALKRHQAVYVSVGETWLNPRTTKAEYQRRHLLAKLTHDVSMIRAYCDLRNPQELVIESESGANVGSRLIIRKCSLTRQEREEIAKEEMKESNDDDKESSEGSEETYPFGGDLRSAHEKSHQNSDKKLHAKKYPWQQNANEEATPEEEKIKKRVHKEAKLKRGNPLQRFVFQDGFISPLSDPTLVFGVTGLDLDNLSGNIEVILCRKSIDDPVQQWEMTEGGFVRLKCSNKLVLGVSMPPYKMGQDEKLTFENCAITVQNLKQQTYGRANQKWLYDPVFNIIQPFQSSMMDKEITAANHVSVCTYAVVGSEVLSQDGYIIDIPADSPVVVCCSCAKVIRGQYQLTKAPDKWAFVCAMGNARKSGMKQRGSFSCLNGKVDLSTYEADTTLNHWVGQLDKLRQETSLRLLNREIQSSMPIQACRVVAMRNGEGRLRAGELIVGTSISGILDQCTQRLSLGSVARRLYTSDGMHILHMEQLIEWATSHFHKQMEQSRSLNEKNDFERGEPEGNPVTPDTQKQDEGNNSREGTPDHNAAEAGIKVTASDLARKLRPPSGRRRLPSEKSTPVQQKHQVQEIPLSVILRSPIEVWVSCGENFIPPATAEKMFEASLNAQMNRNADNLMLDTDKHVLRHMQGRRFKDMSPSNLKATRSPQHPILLEGGWLETTKDEAVKLEQVHKLEEHLSESRPSYMPPRSKGINFNRELYRQANRKRVLVYLNGESSRKAMYVWGECIAEILADATCRLNMHKRAKMLYYEDGSKVTNFDLIERDSLLCATSGDPLKGRPKQSNIAMKANWARVRKQRGPGATEIVITTNKPDITGVDPFGSPSMTSGSIAWSVPEQ